MALTTDADQPIHIEGDDAEIDQNNETIVYDPAKHEANCLDAKTAHVLNCCNGQNSIDQIREQVGGLDDDAMNAVIDELTMAGLISMQSTNNALLDNQSRRRLLELAGLAAIITVPAPTVAQTASTFECRNTPDCVNAFGGVPSDWKCVGFPGRCLPV